MYYPGEVMPIEHDVDREDTIEDVDADNGDEMEKTPEAGQSRRRAPGLARFHGFIGWSLFVVSQLYSEVINWRNFPQ